eukprot:TRINITY_DN6400_c0_g2_i1.p1 TRINITY_DN6400_c0_g2~~TRINITY_DN6400_c0_g2_i1.p1  ORF type:complete len:185 (+),score=16.95 TRINITY_DN6400_c0_g2_i1:74-628(+)
MFAQTWFGLLLMLNLHSLAYRVRTRDGSAADAVQYTIKVDDEQFCCYYDYSYAVSVECSNFCDISKDSNFFRYNSATGRIVSKDTRRCVGYHTVDLDIIGNTGNSTYWLTAVDMHSSPPHKCIVFNVSRPYGDLYYIAATNYTTYKYFNIPPNYNRTDPTAGWALLWNGHSDYDDGTHFRLERV